MRSSHLSALFGSYGFTTDRFKEGACHASCDSRVTRIGFVLRREIAAREARAAIPGRVADASGAVIIGAKVKVISLGAGAELSFDAEAIVIFFTRP